MTKKEDITGKKYGRLTVIERIIGSKISKAKCHCECGNIRNVRVTLLLRGKTKSCGCLNQENNTPISNCSEVELAWAAGFIEGEGTIRINKGDLYT